MKKYFKKFQKIQWRLTFTYTAATLIMLFLVELLVLVSNNKDSFSNPFFINSTARSLSDASRYLNDALDQPYDDEAISSWIDRNKLFMQANMRTSKPTNPRLPAEEPQQQISLFQSKPVPYSQDKSRLIVADPQGVILGVDDESDFPLDDYLLNYTDENEAEILEEIISGSQNSVAFSNNNIQYASFAFPVIQDGETKAIIFMRIVAPTVLEEFEAALRGFLPGFTVISPDFRCCWLGFWHSPCQQLYHSHKKTDRVHHPMGKRRFFKAFSHKTRGRNQRTHRCSQSDG